MRLLKIFLSLFYLCLIIGTYYVHKQLLNFHIKKIAAFEESVCVRLT